MTIEKLQTLKDTYFDDYVDKLERHYKIIQDKLTTQNWEIVDIWKENTRLSEEISNVKSINTKLQHALNRAKDSNIIPFAKKAANLNITIDPSNTPDMLLSKLKKMKRAWKQELLTSIQKADSFLANNKSLNDISSILIAPDTAWDQMNVNESGDENLVLPPNEDWVEKPKVKKGTIKRWELPEAEE